MYYYEPNNKGKTIPSEMYKKSFSLRTKLEYFVYWVQLNNMFSFTTGVYDVIGFMT